MCNIFVIYLIYLFLCTNKLRDALLTLSLELSFICNGVNCNSGFEICRHSYSVAKQIKPATKKAICSLVQFTSIDFVTYYWKHQSLIRLQIKMQLL